MLKREFKAKIVDDFYSAWLAAAAKDEGFSLTACEICYGGHNLARLSDRISGGIAYIQENYYPDIPGCENDFFEKIDNNFVMFKELFTEV